MILKKPSIPLMTGDLFVVSEEHKEMTGTELREEFSKGHALANGNIISDPQYDNEKIIFDLVASPEYPHAAACIGFLYPDMMFLGKMKYRVGNQMKDEDIRGRYQRTENGITIRGEWEFGEGGVDLFVLELSYQRQETGFKEPELRLKNGSAFDASRPIASKALPKQRLQKQPASIKILKGSSEKPHIVLRGKETPKHTEVSNEFFKVEKRVSKNQVYYGLKFKGRWVDTRVAPDGMENTNLIECPSASAFNFDCTKLLGDFTLRVFLRRINCDFCDGELEIMRTSDELIINYYCGFFGPEAFRANLNPYRVMEKVSDLAERFELDTDFKGINETNPLTVFLCYRVRAKGNVKVHITSGVEKINKLFTAALLTLAKEVKQGRMV